MEVGARRVAVFMQNMLQTLPYTVRVQSILLFFQASESLQAQVAVRVDRLLVAGHHNKRNNKRQPCPYRTEIFLATLPTFNM